MSILLVVLLVLAVGAVAAVAAGVVRGGLPDASGDVAPPLAEPLSAPADLDAARFAVSFRGYRMDQVDEVLDEARDVLAARDAEIARLREQLAAPPAGSPAATAGPTP